MDVELSVVLNADTDLDYIMVAVHDVNGMIQTKSVKQFEHQNVYTTFCDTMPSPDSNTTSVNVTAVDKCGQSFQPPTVTIKCQDSGESGPSYYFCTYSIIMTYYY